MFTLPDELLAYDGQSPVFYYLHVNSEATNNSRLHFTKPCITIGINGVKKLQTPGGVEEFGPNDLIFYPPGNYLAYQNFDTDQPYQTLMIFFDPHLIVDLLRQLGDKKEMTSSSLKDHYYLSVRGNSYVAGFGKSILNLLSREQSFKDSLKKIKLMELTCYLNDFFGGFINEETLYIKQHSDHQLKNVIEGSSSKNLTLEEIAFMCNMSLATFKRAFFRIYGTSPGKWIRGKKLAWAEEQIRKHNRPPKEIFNEAGYRDYSSFSYAFKQQFGTSPKQS
jgi:AraC-like DNA-binding protein